MKHELIVITGLLGLFMAAGCDQETPPPAAAAEAAEADRASREASTSGPPLDPMARLTAKNLYSQMDPMVTLRNWGTPTGTANASGPVALADLPAGEGREVTYGLCGACHSMQLVVQQRLPEHHWDELWTWMIQNQGMPDPGPEIRKQIVGYLKQHFSS